MISIMKTYHPHHQHHHSPHPLPIGKLSPCQPDDDDNDNGDNDNGDDHNDDDTNGDGDDDNGGDGVDDDNDDDDDGDDDDDDDDHNSDDDDNLYIHTFLVTVTLFTTSANERTGTNSPALCDDSELIAVAPSMSNILLALPGARFRTHKPGSA
jgi:hypothetical protein